MFELSKQNKSSEEVIQSFEKRIILSSEIIDDLIKKASENKRKRIRLCAHKNNDELVHEMFIVHPYKAYVRPHRHINKIESMLILKGEADYVIFKNDGRLEHSIQMGDLRSGKPFYNSLRVATYHTILIRSKWLVFLEITNGPFNRKDTEFAKWSPEEIDSLSVEAYLNQLERDLNNGSLYT